MHNDIMLLEQALADLTADADQNDPDIKRQVAEIERQINEIKGG